MRRGATMLVVWTTVALAACTLWDGRAAAQPLSACGDVRIRGDARCEVLVEGGCEAQCTPPSVRAECAAELYVNCDAECALDAEASCTASCQADCDATCELDPGEFDCFAYCEGGCEADCEARCEAGDGGAQCRASCQATCTGECDAGCEGTPPSADCSARCEASCEGDCKAEANVDCQAKCQAEGFAQCELDLQGGCEVQCQRPEGALFCEGQFIDTASVANCVDALRERLGIEVEVSGDAEGSCGGGRCEGSAEGSIGCSSSGGGPTGTAAAWVLGTFALLWRGRRRVR